MGSYDESQQAFQQAQEGNKTHEALRLVCLITVKAQARKQCMNVVQVLCSGGELTIWGTSQKASEQTQVF